MKRNPFQPSEFDEQVAIFTWSGMQECVYPELHYLFSTLNGVRLPIGLAVKAKRAGMKRGPLDIWLPCKRGGYSGLVIELKVGDNKPTPEQCDWIEFLNSQGFYACWTTGRERTIETIEIYLEGKIR